MILGIGIDTVNIERFFGWHKKNKEQLSKLFSANEIAYSVSNKATLHAERFAVRFAAREAFFKAFHAMCATREIENTLNLLTVQKVLEVKKNAKGVPTLHVDWPALLPDIDDTPRVHLSLTHTKEVATAIVVLEQK